MHGFALLVAAAALAAMPFSTMARGGGGHSSSGSRGSHSSGSTHHSAGSHSGSGHSGAGTHRSGPHSPHTSSTHAPPSHKATGVTRDSHGKIKRDPEQRAKFMRTHPCPSTGKTHGACPGFVVDHVQALKHGGRDDPGNMQWQSVQAAKAKDKVE